MAAFDRVKSGIPEMDAALDNIRLGDNVVWRVSDLEEFRAFAVPFLRQSAADGRHTVYIRFADHAPVMPKEEAEALGIIVEQLQLSHRFETFTVNVHNLITQHGRDAFYVFDCLSSLQTAWATDLMMGNFFRVTCPYLFQLDTVAFFPLLRGRHSRAAQEKIKDTTQLLLDVYAEKNPGTLFPGGRAGAGIPEEGAAALPDRLYVRPAKVWNRSSDTMLLPHIFVRSSHSFRPVKDGVGMSRFYRIYEQHQRSGEEQSTDSWDRFFRETRVRMRGGEDVSDACGHMCSIMMSRDEHMKRLIRKYFEPEDYFRVRDRMIGTGMIGGKACGMLTARKIIQKDAPDVFEKLEVHDSFYIGSDVFYSYIVDNGMWELRVRQRTKEEYFSVAEEFSRKLKSGRFSSQMEERFSAILDSYGQDPYIVRSSSILEDGFGNAFAGKYESVFCVNTGAAEIRLEEFENAVRTVYASTMSLSALDYRRRRGLDGRDEQMALLVQRVSGASFGRYFMPCAAGVGYSLNPYRLGPDTDPKAGMLRLVAGLGTAAVDRAEGSYPRIVPLDRPWQSSTAGSSQRHRFSQRRIEVIDRAEKNVVRVLPETMAGLVPEYMKRAVMEHDYEAERTFRERGVRREVEFISCEGLVRNAELMASFRRMLSAVSNAYEYPVDTEFTVNLAPDGDFVINLLQCRPLQAIHDTAAGERLAFPKAEDIRPGSVLLESFHASMGVSCAWKIDGIVYIDPVRYYQMDYVRKPDVAHLIGRISRALQGEDALHVLLMVPGRIGTSSPELGVPAAYSDISSFSGICEVAESRIGYNPELSYGSHIFQDLVEAGILYAAVFEGKTTLAFTPEKLLALDNVLGAVSPDAEGRRLADTVHVCCLSGKFRKHFPECAPPKASCMLYHDMQEEHLLCTVEENF